jgi:FAD-dependent urate hydroxylase
MSESPIRTATVVGAGVAGLSVALALAKAGIEPVVHEAHPDGAEGVGAFLTLATNGISALRVIDAAEPVLARGFPTPGIRLRSYTGKFLGETVTGIPLDDGTLSQTLRRADLYSALAETARARGIRIETGRRLVSVRETPTSILARFADGGEASADVLIGCDGVHSTVRRLIDPASRPARYSGLLTTGGYARLPGGGANPAPAGYEMIFGRRGFFGYAARPENPSDVWWFANLPHRPDPSESGLRALREKDWRSELLAMFAADAGPASALIEATPAIMPVSGVHTVPGLRHWARGRMIVIGDAAHAPSPTSGQGASLSIEDAVVLALKLRDRPVEAAFADFCAERRRRVDPIVKAAARINNSKAAGPLGARVRDAMMPAVMRMVARSKATRQVFDHHLAWPDPVGGGGGRNRPAASAHPSPSRLSGHHVVAADLDGDRRQR